MRKSQELSVPESCLSRAGMEELIFVLLSRDAAAPHAIREWAEERVRLGKNKQDDPEIVDALMLAANMDLEGGINRPELRPDQPTVLEGPQIQIGAYEGDVVMVIPVGNEGIRQQFGFTPDQAKYLGNALIRAANEADRRIV